MQIEFKTCLNSYSRLNIAQIPNLGHTASLVRTERNNQQEGINKNQERIDS